MIYTVIPFCKKEGNYLFLYNKILYKYTFFVVFYG